MSISAGSRAPHSPVPRTLARGLSALAGLLLAVPLAAAPIISFAPPGPPLVTGVPGDARSPVEALDLNRDGLLDLVFKTDAKGRVAVLLNLGSGEFGPAHEAAPYDDVFDTAVGDLDADGLPDIVIVRGTSGVPRRTLSILLGDGTGRFLEAPAEAAIPVSPTGAPVVADFDGDERPDVALPAVDPANGMKRVIAIFPGNGEGGLGTPLLIRLEGLFGGLNEIATADLDRDGLPDFVMSAEVLHGGVVFSSLNLGGGHFGPAISEAPGTTALLADFNGDGTPDLLSADPGYIGGMPFWVALGDGQGGFRQMFSDTLGVFGLPRLPAAGDLDGDGRLDILVGGGVNREYVAYLGLGDGRFTRAGNVPSAILLLADLDNDGKADVLSGLQRGLYFHRNNTSEGTATADLVLPVFVASPGAAGAYFSTTLSATNVGETAARLDLTFADADSGGTTSWTTSAPARGQLGSIYPPTGLLPSPYRGTLRVRVTGASSPDAVTLLATTQTRTATGAAGTSSPSVGAEETFEGPAWIGWLAETEQNRSNLAVLNAGGPEDGDVMLRVTLFTTEPPGQPEAVLPDIVLSPGQVHQFNRVLTAAGPAARRGFARVERVSGQGRFYAYAVVNDNRTSDGSYQAAVPEGRRKGDTRLVVPVLVETPAFDSEFVVTNVSEATKMLRLEYVAKTVASPDRTVRFELVLPGRSQVRWERFVEALRQIGFAPLLSTGFSYAGALFIAVTDGNAEGLLAGSRTATVGPSGSYGLYTPAIPFAEAATESAWLAGLRTDDQTRSNIAFVNTGAVDDSPSVFRVEVFVDPDAIPRATLQNVQVGAKNWLQLNSLLGTVVPYRATGFVRVTKSSGNNPFVAYGVNNDGARPGERTGDGSYVPMHVPRQP